MKPEKENTRTKVPRDEAARIDVQNKRDAAKAALPAIKAALEKYRHQNPSK